MIVKNQLLQLTCPPACRYTYVVVGVSLAVSLAVSLLQCLTCNLCGLGKILDILLAAFGTVWWALQAIPHCSVLQLRPNLHSFAFEPLCLPLLYSCFEGPSTLFLQPERFITLRPALLCSLAAGGLWPAA